MKEKRTKIGGRGRKKKQTGRNRSHKWLISLYEDDMVSTYVKLNHSLNRKAFHLLHGEFSPTVPCHNTLALAKTHTKKKVWEELALKEPNLISGFGLIPWALSKFILKEMNMRWVKENVPSASPHRDGTMRVYSPNPRLVLNTKCHLKQTKTEPGDILYSKVFLIVWQTFTDLLFWQLKNYWSEF